MGKGRFLLGMGVAVVAMGTYAIHPVGASTGGGPTASQVLGSGSDTTVFTMEGLDTLYQESPGCQDIALSGTSQVPAYDFSCYPDPAPPAVTVHSENYVHDQVHEAYQIGSGNGIHQLCNQGVAGNAAISFARSSRAPGSSDCSGLHFVAYARDGIPMEVFKNFTNNGTDAGPCAGKANCLSQQQIKDIYHLCTINDWHQIDPTIAAGTTIVIYDPQAGSGTRGTFDNFMGGTNFSETCIDAIGGTYQATHVIQENENVAIAANGDSANAVFPFSYGIWTQQIKPHNTLGASLTQVDGVTATPKTILNFTFPYGRYIFNVFCAATNGTGCDALGTTASQATINYVGEEGWICKPGSGTWAADGGPHTINPLTGNNYQADIAKTIKAFAFQPLKLGTIGGGDLNKDYCNLFTT
jgi:ABC-type phosphate transport system substrate-binding protein